VVEDGVVVGFGEVMPDGEHPSGQTVQDGKRYMVYPIDTSGVERKWRYARQSVDGVQLRARAKKDGGFEIEIGKSSGMYKSVWIDTKYDANKYGTQLLEELVPGADFDFPKSLYNVLDCLKGIIQDDPDAIVLDFFGGSGTTGHAVLELNKADAGRRRFILVEQMDYVSTITAPRVAQVIKNNGEGSFVYCELKELNQAIAELVQAAKTTKDLIKLWEEVRDTDYVSYRVIPNQFDPAVFGALPFERQQHVLMETLDKNRLYVNYCDIDDEDYCVGEDDKKFNASFYGTQ
jgi:adenine-specific DNA-methyltransferase